MHQRLQTFLLKKQLLVFFVVLETLDQDLDQAFQTLLVQDELGTQLGQEPDQILEDDFEGVGLFLERFYGFVQDSQNV